MIPYLVAAFVAGVAACWLTFWLIAIRGFLPGLWADLVKRWRRSNDLDS